MEGSLDETEFFFKRKERKGRRKERKEGMLILATMVLNTNLLK